MKKRKFAKDLAFVTVSLLLVLVMLYSGFRLVESTVLRPGQTGEEVASKTVIRDGVAYYPRQDITTMMVLGIDQSGPVAASGSYQNPGAADMVMLLIFDEVREVYNILQLNRDTMVEMPVLGLGGKQAGVFYGQLALAHTYGSGLHDSCENTKKTISDFLNGIYIDYYMALNMDAIGILTDGVGGVTVNVSDDFSKVDDTLKMGQVTLTGEQAVSFVQTRKDVGDQLNLSRIQRQREYIDGFLEAFKAQQTSEELLAGLYEDVTPYMVTDCSLTVLSNMVSHYQDYTLGQITSLPGENILGEEYFEFYVDEEKLDAYILELFYAPKG